MHSVTHDAANVTASAYETDDYQVTPALPTAPLAALHFPRVAQIATPGVTYGVTTDDCTVEALTALAVARATGQYAGVRQ